MSLTEQPIEMTMIPTKSKKKRKKMETLCRRCRFHPASPRIAGYCSWDCHDADDEDGAADEEGEKAA